TEALGAGIERAQRRFRAAGPADQVGGVAEGTGTTAGGSFGGGSRGHWEITSFIIFLGRLSPSRNWHRVRRSAGCRGVTGPNPSSPLDDAPYTRATASVRSGSADTRITSRMARRVPESWTGGERGRGDEDPTPGAPGGQPGQPGHAARAAHGGDGSREGPV